MMHPWIPIVKCDKCYAFKECDREWMFPFESGWVQIFVWRERKNNADKQQKKIYCPGCAKKLGFDKL